MCTLLDVTSETVPGVGPRASALHSLERFASGGTIMEKAFGPRSLSYSKWDGKLSMD
jgi:hypothetical protein